MFAFIDANDVERLIMDVRGNRGGNNGKNRALIYGLIRCDKFPDAGSLYTITDRGTFSAAMMFVPRCREVHEHALCWRANGREAESLW